MGLPQLVIASFETAFNQYIALDPDAMPRFEAMEGKVIAIDITGINETLYLFPGMDGMMLMSDFDGEADTTLSGTPLALARLSLEKNAMPVLFTGDVTITGDTRLGHQFKKILASLNIDWEEQLSRITGDLIARQIGNGVKDLSSWLKRSKQSFDLDIGEYLQEESHILPTRPEVDRWVGNVDGLRNAIDRLQARVNRLKNKN
ncbi:MAG: SCP2 sterol-binding domain-containing protein [Gammaproteobacteria bacterium]|nr:SCP2 sterol-binding domain-containing protein [Gammaproteobacteria bacterium]MCW8911349.1 SCP2 sterol-binding domain-containing protein [Gammaproteobacteria bacterium]MCW9005158.1 SCP2 sterol-binding domain-containing protein [Gammaproteobacteria bacterium]MCW9055529.1 SCP2 sterol-binding domain-containing protein [Gammaproteobacteria bacterium]